MAGAEVPGDRDYDGESILAVLKGEVTQKSREFLYYDLATLQGYRNGDWKLKLPYEGYEGSRGKKGVPPHDTLLFNLKSDPGEESNLAKEEPEKLAEMLELMERYVSSKGGFPPSLPIGDMADHSFYDTLEKRHGTEYFKVVW
jgi:arylsulfatase A-like enzyme